MGALMVLGRREAKYDQGLRRNLPRTDLAARTCEVTMPSSLIQDCGTRTSAAPISTEPISTARSVGEPSSKALISAPTSTMRSPSQCQTTLEGADLDGAKLEGANLRGANLKNATLQEAKLSPYERADGTSKPTILEGADLDGAHLEGANLTRANLSGQRRLDGGRSAATDASTRALTASASRAVCGDDMSAFYTSSGSSRPATPG